MSNLNTILFPPAFLEEESYELPFVDPNKISQSKHSSYTAPVEETYTQSSSNFKYGHNMPTSVVQKEVDISLQKGICLAEACGNCALAYGSPLTCALKEVEVKPLACCSDYLSPFKLVS